LKGHTGKPRKIVRGWCRCAVLVTSGLQMRENEGREGETRGEKMMSKIKVA
jgi:hypothetical protein